MTDTPPASGYVIEKHADKIAWGIIAGLIIWAGTSLQELIVVNARLEEKILAFEKRIDRTEKLVDIIDRRVRVNDRRGGAAPSE